MLFYFFNFDNDCCTIVYQIGASYASVDKRRHNNFTDPTGPKWSIKREHHSDARFCGAVEKKEIESKHRAGPGGNQGNEGAGGSRVLPTAWSSWLRERKREKGPSCSRPRNNVSGLWFFIRARSHNGGSQSDSSTERSSLHERDDGRKARRR